MESPFRSDQLKALETPIDKSKVAHRSGGGGMQLSYLKGHEAIDTANRIFGYGNWGYDLQGVELQHVHDEKGEIIGSYYAARVKLTVTGCIPITEEGVNPIQEGRNPRAKIDAHDMARKGAITDAMKRALRCFGDQFGNSLYDTDLVDGQPKPEPSSTGAKSQNQPSQPTRAATTQNSPAPISRPTQAPTAPQQPRAVTPPAAPSPIVSVEDDANFKVYKEKIHGAKTLTALSALGPEMRRMVVDQAVLRALGKEYSKAESALGDKANQQAAEFIGAMK